MELDNTFINALLADFRTHAANAIRRCREKHVPAYLGVIARILPKELAIEVARTDEEKNGQLDRILAHFSELRRERDEARERLEGLRDSTDGEGGDQQQIPALKNGA